jgi:hypothetical protein
MAVKAEESTLRRMPGERHIGGAALCRFGILMTIAPRVLQPGCKLCRAPTQKCKLLAF